MVTSPRSENVNRVTRFGWVMPAAWSLLAVLTLALLSLAVYLLFRMDLFAEGPLTDEQAKTLWAFLGVAIGTVATLIGSLLTEQNSRRLDDRAREAGDRAELAAMLQDQQNSVAERRLTLDTRAKVLELVSHEGDYAPKAQVAAAVATMMELHGGPVAMRILGELWGDGRISTQAAVWLIEQVLEDEGASAADKGEAAANLWMNAAQLIPAKDDDDQDWNSFPDVLRGPWPTGLPESAKVLLVLMMIRAILARERAYWEEQGGSVLIDALSGALEDGDEAVRILATMVLAKLCDLEVIDPSPTTSTSLARCREELPDVTPWVRRLVDRFEPWAHGEDTAPISPQEHPAPVRPLSEVASTPESSGPPDGVQDKS